MSMTSDIKVMIIRVMIILSVVGNEKDECSFSPLSYHAPPWGGEGRGWGQGRSQVTIHAPVLENLEREQVTM